LGGQCAPNEKIPAAVCIAGIFFGVPMSVREVLAPENLASILLKSVFHTK